MSSCKMNETKLEVSENYEEADLSDVEDDVFVRGGGRNGYRLEYDIAKKPLMTPRKKPNAFDNFKNGGLHTEVRSSPNALRVLCIPMCYVLIATFAMLGIIAVITFLTNYISWPLPILHLWRNGGESTDMFTSCDNVEVEDVWVRQFPKLLTESSFRLLDVNSDGVQDIILGYATGADGYNVPEFVCDIYFNGLNPCFGGVLALDGRNGDELWRHWTSHEVFAINCNEDISGDDIPDCLVGGRAGVFCALNGATGNSIWSFEDETAKNPIMNIYTAQFIKDINDDGVLDILAVHGGDPLAKPGSKTRLSGRLILVSGKNGEVLQWVGTPDQKESYYSPQIFTHSDGTDYVLFGTGGETHGGGLYALSISELYRGSTENVRVLYRDSEKGVMVPPVLVDVNEDHVQDIVMAMFNSTVIAFDGVTFEQLWNQTFPSSETYITPTPGFYNKDKIPDFMVKYQFGPGFPLYYNAETTILDGATGKPILEKPIIDTIGSQASTPVIRTEGFGNDIFLYWSSNCKGYEGNSSQFAFVKGTTVHEQSRADFCKLRFRSKLINQLRAFNRKMGLPGILIYDSEMREAMEYNNSKDTSEDGQKYLRLHPEMWQYYDRQFSNTKDSSETFTGYPASAVLSNGIVDQMDQVDNDQYLPSYPGVASVYDLPSQPEYSDTVKYPSYHNVHKHGKYTMETSPVGSEIAGGGGLSNGNSLRDLNIVVDRRDQGEAPFVNSRPPENVWERLAAVEKGPGRSYSTNYKSKSSSRPSGRLRYFPDSPEPDNDPQADIEEKLKEGEFPFHPQTRWIAPNSQRRKRHIGPHDNKGIQRLISTGTLAKPLNESSGGIDLIFATYWFYPAKAQAILPRHQECIQEKLSKESQRFDERSKYYGMDHDAYEDAITDECLQQEEDDIVSQQASEDAEEQIYQSQSSYNPFDIHMGQMTVYRMHIKCSCSELQSKDNGQKGTGRRCAKILPFEDQPWTGYMGSHANSYFASPISTSPESKATQVTPSSSPEATS